MNAESQPRSAYLKQKPQDPELLGILAELLEAECGLAWEGETPGGQPKDTPHSHGFYVQEPHLVFIANCFGRERGKSYLCKINSEHSP